MLVVDINTLHLVHALYFFDEVLIDTAQSLDPEDIMRIERTLCNTGTSVHMTAGFHFQTGTVRNIVLTHLAICVRGHHNLCRIILQHLNGSDGSGFFTDFRETFRLTRFEKFLDSRKTLCDISTRNTTGVEGTHSQLGTRFPDGLRRCNPDGFADFDRLSGCQASAVALAADTGFALAGKYRADLYLLDTGVFNIF